MARASGDAALYLRIVTRMSQTFSIDASEVVLADVEAFGKAPLTVQVRSDFAEGLVALAEDAVATENVDAAAKLLAAALVNAKRAKNRELTKAIAVRQADVKEQGEQAAEVKAARKSLEAGDNPVADLTVGKYFAFGRNDWEAALPHLAKCSDAGIKEAATLELAPPKTPGEQLAVADAWHAVGEAAAGREKAKFLAHSVVWYREALPRLDGLAQVKAKKRLAELIEAEKK